MREWQCRRAASSVIGFGGGKPGERGAGSSVEHRHAALVESGDERDRTERHPESQAQERTCLDRIGIKKRSASFKRWKAGFRRASRTWWQSVTSRRFLPSRAASASTTTPRPARSNCWLSNQGTPAYSRFLLRAQRSNSLSRCSKESITQSTSWKCQMS